MSLTGMRVLLQLSYEVSNMLLFLAAMFLVAGFMHHRSMIRALKQEQKEAMIAHIRELRRLPFETL